MAAYSQKDGMPMNEKGGMPNGSKNAPSEKSTQFMSAPPPDFSTNFASLSMHQYDRIRLLQFPPEITQVVRQTISRSWHRGIQDERNYGGSFEFKLYGNPWYGRAEDASHARRLMQQIFESLWNAGWLLYLSTDISKKQTDKDTLIFRHQTPSPPPCDWISIGFSRNDRIRILDAPRDVCEAVTQELRPFVQDSRPYGSVANIWEIKIYGYPWHATGEETMKARLLLLKLIVVLERFGYTVYASIDQKATTQEHHSESDTWHCRRPRNWQAGAPVYHN